LDWDGRVRSRDLFQSPVHIGRNTVLLSESQHAFTLIHIGRSASGAAGEEVDFVQQESHSGGIHRRLLFDGVQRGKLVEHRLGFE
jgi:hypothetical protein